MQLLDPAAWILADYHGRRSVWPMAVDRLVDLLAVDRNVLRRDDAEAHFVTTNLHDRDDNIVVDNDTLVFFPGQDKHGCVSFRKSIAPTGRDLAS